MVRKREAGVAGGRLIQVRVRLLPPSSLSLSLVKEREEWLLSSLAVSWKSPAAGSRSSDEGSKLKADVKHVL